MNRDLKVGRAKAAQLFENGIFANFFFLVFINRNSALRKFCDAGELVHQRKQAHVTELQHFNFWQNACKNKIAILLMQKKKKNGGLRRSGKAMRARNLASLKMDAA